MVDDGYRDKFDEIAERGLANYAVEKPRFSFLQHSDNITYKVSTTLSKTYLLRIHVPITSALGIHGADYGMVNSEMVWLEALARETKLVLPEPVHNRMGDLVTQITWEGDEPINCTLLSWIQGVPYHRDLESEHTVYHIGKTLATLHDQASRWETPVGFARPKRDIRYFTHMLEGLTPAVKDGRINRSDFAELSQSINLLVDMMNTLCDDKEYNGIMHADPHKGNWLYHEGQIRLIDFSFCAFGNYMFDLGICLSDMKAEFRPLCLDGYRSVRELPDNFQKLIEGFYVGSMVGTFSYMVPNPGAQEILARKVPQIAQAYARKFNRGEDFWLLA